MLNDPDNYQRLVQVRDWMGGQSWWDTKQHRIDPPTGLQMHWSRLGDLPLGLLIHFFSLFAEHTKAEMLAVVSLPPLLLFVTIIFLCRTARNIGSVPAERFLQLFVIATSFFLAQFIPGRIDHHGLQLLLLSAALAAATAMPTKRSGLLTSLSVAIALLIGLETAPLLLAIPAWMALNWLWKGEAQKAQLQGFLIGILFFLPFLYMISVAPSDWNRLTNDQVGIGHLAIIAMAAASLALILQFKLRSLEHRLAGLAIFAIATALPVLAFREVLAAPYSAIDPLLQQLWIGSIAETQSAWPIADTNPLRLLRYHLFPALALLAATGVYLATGREPKLLLILMVGLAGFALSIWQIRAMAAASMVALLLCSITIAHLWQKRSEPLGTARLFASMLILNGHFGFMIYHMVAPDDRQGMSMVAETTLTNRCETQLRGEDYNQVRPGLVLNGISSGALILARTHHSVLAAANHRGIEGNGKAYRILLAPSSEAHVALARNGVDYVLTCRDSELERLAQYAPDSLAADLVRQHIPEWLLPISHEGGEAVLFFAISPDKPLSETPKTGQHSM